MKFYLDQMKANGLTDGTIKTVQLALSKLNVFKPLGEVTKDDLVKYFSEFQGKPEYQTLHKKKIKKYYNDIGKPELVSWIKINKSAETIVSDDILTTEDINKMLEAADGQYWQALITFLFETGCRIGEARSLKFKDFKETNNGMIIDIPSLKTKSQPRRMPLLLSAQYIRNYRLYSSKSENDKVFNLDLSHMTKTLKKIGLKAGITKPIHPHMFRHAQATIMVQQGTQEAIIRKKMGWSPTSGIIARYQHLNDNAVVEALTGIKTEIILTDIKQPDKLNVVDNSILISKLMEERDQQDKKIALLMEKLEQQERGIKTKFAEIEEKIKVTHTVKKIPGQADFYEELVQFPRSKPKVNEIIKEKIIEEEPLTDEMLSIKEMMPEDEFKKIKSMLDFKKLKKKGDKIQL